MVRLPFRIMKGCFCMQMKRWHTLVHTATVLLSFINPLWRNYQAFKKTSFTYGVVQPHRTSNIEHRTQLTGTRDTMQISSIIKNFHLILCGQLLPKTGSFYGTARDRKYIPAAYLISNNFIFQKKKIVSPPSKSVTCKI